MHRTTNSQIPLSHLHCPYQRSVGAVPIWPRSNRLTPLAKAALPVPFARDNGSDHVHSNSIEGNEFAFACHIHAATE